MRHQPVLADIDPVGEAALDHVPAERPLRRAQQQNPAERRKELLRQPAAQPEIQKRYGVDDADQPSPEAVHVFPPVDRLEIGEAHAGVEQPVLRNMPVFLELRGPARGRERRQDAGDRLPLGDRQPGERQPGNAADDDHREDHCATAEQPNRDRPHRRGDIRAFIAPLGYSGREGHPLQMPADAC